MNYINTLFNHISYAVKYLPISLFIIYILLEIIKFITNSNSVIFSISTL